MKKIVLIVGGLLFMFVVILGMVFVNLSKNMNEIKSLEIEGIDPAQLEDGSYTGSYYYEDQIGATLTVIIENGEITDILFIEHLYGLGGKAETIIDDIIEEQSLEVDAVSGATTSSHIIKLAVQNALEEK